MEGSAVFGLQSAASKTSLSLNLPQYVKTKEPLVNGLPVGGRSPPTDPISSWHGYATGYAGTS